MSSCWEKAEWARVAPSWRADGQELFCKGNAGSDFMAVDVREENGSLKLSTPKKLSFRATTSRESDATPYDVSADCPEISAVEGR